MTHRLIATATELREALAPIFAGRVSFAAFDTETNEVKDDRFTPWGTDLHIGGFSISFDDTDGSEVDLYAPIRHEPYDWRRRRDLIAAHDARAGTRWVSVLEDEGITADGAWEPGMDPNVDPDEALAVLAEVLALPGVAWGAHNWRFDASVLLADGVTPPWPRLVDTHVVSVFTDERPLDRWDEAARRYHHTGHALKQLGQAWLGVEPDEQELLEEAREVLRCDHFCMLPLRSVIAPYGARDTRLVLALWAHEIKRDSYQDVRVRELIRRHTDELRLAIEMERRGIGVDPVGARTAAKASEEEVGVLLRYANDVAGHLLPMGNGDALADLLYATLGLPIYAGNRNTRAATLKQVRQMLLKVPGTQLPGGFSADNAATLIDLILDYRRAEKELTSFYRPLALFGASHRVHTILRTLQAKTTRYSSSKPNVQQAPRAGNVRRLFQPRDGHVLLLLDYSQQELRVASHYAQAIPATFDWRFTWRCTMAKRGTCKGKAPHGPKDDLDACKQVTHVGYQNQKSHAPRHMGLVEGFLSGDRAFDPHQSMVTACHAQGYGHVDRALGKTANFLLLYGGGPRKLSESLDLTEADGRSIHSIFWDEAYPELGRVRDFIGERLRNAGPKLRFSHEHHITTLHGGRIHLDDGYHGLNYLVQRSSREILNRAITATAAYCHDQGVPYEQILPIHDELMFELPADSLDETVVRQLCQIMVEAGDASTVPMIVDPKVGETSWGETSAMPEAWGYNGVTDRV